MGGESEKPHQPIIEIAIKGMPSENIARFVLKASSALLISALGFTPLLQAQAAEVLKDDQSVVTVDSDSARTPVAISPQTDKAEPLQVVRQMSANDKIYFLA